MHRTSFVPGTLLGVAALVLALTAGSAPAAVPETVGFIDRDITRAYPGGTFGGPYGIAFYRVSEPLPDPDLGGESALANLVADAFKASLGEPVTSRIGIVSPTSFGADLWHVDSDLSDDYYPYVGGPSPVTRDDVAAVLPGDERLWSTTLTGAQLARVLEQQWPAADAPPGRGYLQLGLSSNFTYTYDETQEHGRRITSLAVDRQPVDPDAEYVVLSTQSLVQAGAEGFTELAAGIGPAPVETGPDRTSQDSVVTYFLRATGTVYPDDNERAVGLPALPERMTVSDPIVLELSGLNMTSLGISDNHEVDVFVDGEMFVFEAGVWRQGDGPHASSGPIEFAVTMAGDPVIFQIDVRNSGTTVIVGTEVVAGPRTTRPVLYPERTTQMYGVLWPVVRVRAEVGPSPDVTGTIEVVLDETVVSSHELVNGGATFDLPSTLPAGAHGVRVRYLGDAAHAPSESESLAITVEPVRSATTLAVRTPSVSFLPTVWTSTVRLASGARPVGRVELREGSTVRARARLVAGIAVGAVPRLSTGSHRLTAVFVPDDRANVLGSGSTDVTVRR